MKKLWVILLCITILVSLCACGGREPAKTDDVAPTAEKANDTQHGEEAKYETEQEADGTDSYEKNAGAAFVGGAYEDNYGLFGIYQFNEDGTVNYYYDFFSDEDTEPSIGKYQIGEDGTVYITGIEFELAEMCSVLQYDRSADVFTCSVDGTTLVFAKTDIVLD